MNTIYEAHYNPCLVTYGTSCSRVAFTAEDDMHLCEYIASVIPDQEADGGRFGREIYQRLVRSAEFVRGLRR